MPHARRTSSRAALASVAAVSAITLTVVGGYVAATGASAESDASGATAAGVLTATQTVTVTATVTATATATATATVTVPGPTRTVTAAPTQPGSAASATPQTGPAAPTVRSSTLFGAYPGFSSPTDQSEPLASRLARVSDEFGGKLGVTRIFRGGRLTLPPMTGPSIVSWNFPVVGTLAGQYDAQIDAIARGATHPL
jgi:hypothetical protein